jgi:hypothetical protein
VSKARTPRHHTSLLDGGSELNEVFLLRFRRLRLNLSFPVQASSPELSSMPLKLSFVSFKPGGLKRFLLFVDSCVGV